MLLYDNFTIALRCSVKLTFSQFARVDIPLHSRYKGTVKTWVFEGEDDEIDRQDDVHLI